MTARMRSEVFFHRDDVFAFTPFMGAGIEHVADEMDAQSADVPLGSGERGVGGRLIEGIEAVAIIANPDGKVVRMFGQMDADLVFVGIIVTILDDVGDQFLNREIGGENDVGSNAIGLQEFRRGIRHVGQFAEVVAQTQGGFGSHAGRLARERIEINLIV